MAAVFWSVVLHGAVAAALLFSWSMNSESRILVRPPPVPATLVRIDIQAPPAATRVDKQAATRARPPTPSEPVNQRAATPPPDTAKAPDKVVEEPPEPLESPEVAEQRRQQELAAAQRRQAREQLAQSGLTSAIEHEANALDQSQAARTAEELAESYAGRIRAAIESVWKRPPSARNGMRADLLIQLVPTGEVVSVTVVEGSGDAAFDRSAERAVRRLGSLEVPQEREVFETFFRSLRLTFQPEDLMR